MATETRTIQLQTTGNGQIIDITGQVAAETSRAAVRDGIVTVFNPGATGALTTLEFEPGLVEDLRTAMERLVPQELEYAHHRTWNDGNGHSHVRASLLGPSLTVPLKDGKPVLGRYQQIIFIEFDVRPRDRELVLQIVG